MEIGILGTGHVNEKALAWASISGINASTGTFADAAQFGDVPMLAKAFNTVGHAHMFKPDFPCGPPDMFICGR